MPERQCSDKLERAIRSAGLSLRPVGFGLRVIGRPEFHHIAATN